jgi:hypothetical protein
MSVVSSFLTRGELYSITRKLGIDVPMTPFTADMALMISNTAKKDAYYKKSFSIYYQSDVGIKKIAAEKLGWYEFIAPFQWLSECRGNGNSCSHAIFYLCHSLSDYTKVKVQSWRAEENDLEIGKVNENVGFGVKYKCIMN